VKENENYKKIWIAWERQRRSIELADAFNAELFLILESGFFRYFKCLTKTILVLKKERPDILFVQNPSMILAFFSVVLIKPIFKCNVIVDRHSNFLLSKKKRNIFHVLLFQFLSFLSIKYADLTIITNKELAYLVDILGGNPFILPDKIPNIKVYNVDKTDKLIRVFVVSSFAGDEPIGNLIEASKLLDNTNIRLIFSGNYKKYSNQRALSECRNIELTGFLSDSEYERMLNLADLVIVLTTINYTLLCGCYEAIAVEKPLITSNSNTLKNLFKGATFTDNSPSSIVNSINEVLENNHEKTHIIKQLRKTLDSDWNQSYSNLIKIITDLNNK
jgi:hypothetical protein